MKKTLKKNAPREYTEEELRQGFIDGFLITFARYWKEHPYLRFGQIIEIIILKCCSFYIEDDEFLKKLKDLIGDDE